MTSDSDTCFFSLKGDWEKGSFFFLWRQQGRGVGCGKLRMIRCHQTYLQPHAFCLLEKASNVFSFKENPSFYQENPSFYRREFPVNQGFSIFTPVRILNKRPTNQTDCMRGRAGTRGGYQCLPCQASATSLQLGLSSSDECGGATPCCWKGSLAISG